MDSKYSNDTTNSVDEEYEYKHQWLREQMRNQIPKFSNPQTLRVFCGTWNCNNKVFYSEGSSSNDTNSTSKNSSEQLKNWLFAGSDIAESPSLPTNDNPIDQTSSIIDSQESMNIDKSLIKDITISVPLSSSSTIETTEDTVHSITHPDIYIIGFQEIVELTPMNVVMTNQNVTDRTNYWRQQIEEHINQSSEYILLQEKCLVGLLLFIYVKSKYHHSIRDIRSLVIPTGVLGIMGNKGAVCVRFDFQLTSICVVCSHFHAGRENVSLRSLDYHTIIDKSYFLPLYQIKDIKRRESVSRWWIDEWSLQTYHIFDHDVIFWIGDLNYRIDESISTEELFKNIQMGAYSQYLSKDQLIIERNKHTVFDNFHEGMITFAPSYKYQPGTDIYECRSDKKLRAPAWCDRILYRCKNDFYKQSINLLYYNKINLMLSDHKPVCGIFNLSIRIPIVDRQREVYQSLLRVIDHWENSTTPKVELLDRMINFGVVTYLVEKSIRIPLKNIGGVFAHWAFVPKLDEKEICKRWLKLIPSEGVLAPGEVTEIIAKIIIDEQTAKDIRDGNIIGNFEDIIVLRMTRGSDFFLSITAEIDYDTISGLNTRLDDIYNTEAAIEYYREDD